MLATLVDAPFHRPGWVWEEKYDGIRLIALKDGRRVRLLTRNDKDRTADFPEVAAALAALPAPDAGARRRGRGVRRRRRLALPAPAASRARAPRRPSTSPSTACTRAAATSAASRSRPARRAGGARCARARACRVARRLADDGFRAFAEARRRGLEGVIGKDPRAPYVPGVRSPAWCKVKVRAEEEFVIGGFTAPRGRPPRTSARSWSAPGTARAPLRGQGRHGLHRGDARRSPSPPAAARAPDVALRRRAPRPRRHLGRAPARRPARLHRAHRRRQAPPPRLPRACATTRAPETSLGAIARGTLRARTGAVSEGARTRPPSARAANRPALDRVPARTRSSTWRRDSAGGSAGALDRRDLVGELRVLDHLAHPGRVVAAGAGGAPTCPRPRPRPARRSARG